jgi:DNA-binding transcriptional ArsR family regulator
MKQKSKSVVCADAENAGQRLAAVDAVALDRAARLFRALADGPRLRLLQYLQSGESCVTELVRDLGEKFPTVSQRLRVLWSEGLVRRRRAGLHVYYSLADRHVVDLLTNALAHAAELHVSKNYPGPDSARVTQEDKG